MQISSKVSKLENTINELDQKSTLNTSKIDAAATIASKNEGSIRDI